MMPMSLEENRANKATETQCEKMKAIVCTKYGSPDGLQLNEVEKPTPKDNQVLVRVYAASVNKADLYLLKHPFLVRLFGGGLLKPKRKILGTDIAGRVEAVGRNVKQFQQGDEVFGGASGSFAEYVCAREDLLALKPTNVTFEEAAAAPVAAITAIQALRDKGHVQPGQKVLINGASGGVGTFEVQIAKSLGAEVTAVCSTGKLNMVRSIGADHVIDYTQEDATKSGQRYDLIIAANGYHPILNYRRALNPKGICVTTGGSMTQIFQGLLLGPLISMIGSKKMVSLMAKLNNTDLVFIKQLLEAGKVVPVIDRRYKLSEVPEAIRYVEEGHAKGKVVITLEHNS
jgi:NADPH:quinone reductase-like Zn-dependent oxidoreductase